MVHTDPNRAGKWTQYERLNTDQRRSLARSPHSNFQNRLAKNRKRKILPEQGMNIAEMPNQSLHNIINFQGWQQFVLSPTEPYDPVLVREFYAAMVPPAFAEWKMVTVRGRRITITKDAISRYYGVPPRPTLDSTFGIPPIPNVSQDEQYSSIIAQSLRRNGYDRWFPSSDKIKKAELRPEIGILLRFVKTRLAPSTHYSTVSWYVGRILYCLQNMMLIDIGYIIFLNMIDAASDRCTGILPFPCLITKLCRDAGVNIGPTQRVPLPLDRAAYRAHEQTLDRDEQGGGDDGGDDEYDEEEDVDYDPEADEGDEPEDPRILGRIDCLRTEMHGRFDTISRDINRGMYNLSLLMRGHEVPDNAFTNPDDEAGPSNPRSERQSRRRRRG